MSQPAPSPWVERFIGGVRAGGRVLDVACGGGRHLALCLDRGLAATGVDREIGRAREALGPRPGLDLLECDLESGSPFPFPAASFAGVIVTNYLWRPILSGIVAAVAADGLLLYETFRSGNERHGKPSRPEFLLAPGELLTAATAGGLAVIAFEEALLEGPERVVQHICAVGPAHPWVAMPPRMQAVRSSA